MAAFRPGELEKEYLVSVLQDFSGRQKQGKCGHTLSFGSACQKTFIVELLWRVQEEQREATEDVFPTLR